MFGYSIPLLAGRLFGIPLFVLGVIFLWRFRKVDDPKRVLKQCLKHPLVWFSLILTWVAFAIELVYLSNQSRS